MGLRHSCCLLMGKLLTCADAAGLRQRSHDLAAPQTPNPHHPRQGGLYSVLLSGGAAGPKVDAAVAYHASSLTPELIRNVSSPLSLQAADPELDAAMNATFITSTKHVRPGPAGRRGLWDLQVWAAGGGRSGSNRPSIGGRRAGSPVRQRMAPALNALHQCHPLARGPRITPCRLRPPPPSHPCPTHTPC